MKFSNPSFDDQVDVAGDEEVDTEEAALRAEYESINGNEPISYEQLLEHLHAHYHSTDVEESHPADIEAHERYIIGQLETRLDLKPEGLTTVQLDMDKFRAYKEVSTIAASFRTEFDQIDDDNSNYITHKEFREYIKLTSKYQGPDLQVHMDHVLSQIDPENTNKITYAKFIEYKSLRQESKLLDAKVRQIASCGGLTCCMILFIVLYFMISALFSFEMHAPPDQLGDESGALAGLDERACRSSPCQNGGYCVTDFHIDSFHCRCQSQCTTGTYCEILNRSCVEEVVGATDGTVFNASTTTWVSRLKRHLLANYDPYSRPIQSQRPTQALSASGVTTSLVDVKISMGFLQLVEVNPKDQTWTANIWLRASWTDPFLAWDPAEWGGITEINLDPNPESNKASELWVPDISFYNLQGEPIIGRKPAYVYSSGYVYWSRPMVVTMACDISLKDFPFDANECIMHIGCWTDHGFEVAFQPGSVQVDGLYIPNNEFVITSSGIWQEAKFYPNLPEPWPELFYAFTIHRIPQFYLIALVLPTVIITYLGWLQFYIHPTMSSADRLGLPAALLLTLVAVTFVVAQNFPVSSETTRLQTLTVLSILWLGGSMVISTFVIFLGRLNASVPSPFIKTFLAQIHEDRENDASQFLDFCSLGLFTKGFKAIMIQVKDYRAGKVHSKVNTTVTMAEVGEVIDLLARILYICSYTWVVAYILDRETYHLKF